MSVTKKAHRQCQLVSSAGGCHWQWCPWQGAQYACRCNSRLGDKPTLTPVLSQAPAVTRSVAVLGDTAMVMCAALWMALIKPHTPPVCSADQQEVLDNVHTPKVFS